MKYLKISLILGSIALVCAVILASINMLTSPIIADNKEKSKKETIEAIYSEFDHYTSLNSDELKEKYGSDKIDDKISERIAVYSASEENDDTFLGAIYTVSGRNAYGLISLMVAISKNDTVYQVEFLENGQSFASTVATWVKEKYRSKGAKTYEAGFTSDTVAGEELNINQINDLKLDCGATYGATLVKELTLLALNTEKEVA